MAREREVERGTDCGRGMDHQLRSAATFAQPFQQRIAAERDPGGEHRRPARDLLQAAQDPVDLVAVAGVVGARQAVGRATAAAKVWHDAAPAAGGGGLHQAARVVRAAASFQAVEEDEERDDERDRERRGVRLRHCRLRWRDAHRCCARRTGGVDPVEFDEVAVGRVPALAPVGGQRRLAGDRKDCLQVAAGQPPRRAVVGWPLQCTTRGDRSPKSACSGIGEAWCSTMRQPFGPRT